MRAVGYFRDRSARSETLTEESRLFLEFCRENGFEAAATFLDVGEKSSEDTGYRQLVEYLRQQQQRGFLVVVVSSFGSLGVEAVQAVRR
ncbi:MAG TPA: hypothetical protein VNL15_01765, partial [Dehalococcoidia bacterium]|nr:hypothetical protein [Dehalococcoidia bacterium]